MALKITRCEGEGQGSCTRCDEKGIWNRHWMSMLVEIEGMEGCYCSKCLKELKAEIEPHESEDKE